LSTLAVRPENISLFTETQYLSKILIIMLSSSSSFLPTRISEEVGKDIITPVSQIGNINSKKEVKG
jgi:hypothetical protein